MSFIRIRNSDNEPVAISDLKDYMRMYSEDEKQDILMKSLITAAREDFEASTNLILMRQVWQYNFEAKEGQTKIPIILRPVEKISWIKINKDVFLNVNGTPEEGGSYYLSRSGRQLNEIALNQPLKNKDKVRIELELGMEELNIKVLADIRHALLMLSAYWFEFRTCVFIQGQLAGYPLLYQQIVNKYKLRRL